MRRALLAAAVLVVVLASGAAPAAAAAEDWAGSAITTTSTASPNPTLRAVFTRTSWPGERRLVVTTLLTSPADQPVGCVQPAPNPPTTVTWDGTSRAYVVEAPITTTCNGTYGITFTARLDTRGCLGTICGSWRPVDEHTLTGSIAVAAPGPAVDASTAAGADRSVVVSWDEVAAPPADLLGFRVERRATGGAWTFVDQVDDPGGEAGSVTDSSPPAEGGEVSYRVLSRRSGPSGEVLNASGRTSSEEVAAAPAPDPGDPAGPEGPAAPGDPGGSPTPGDGSGGTGDAGTGGAGGSGGRVRTGGRIQVPRLGITGTFLPPLLQPSVSPVRSTTPSTVDDGFDEALPYDPSRPDAPEPEIVGEETAANVLIDAEAGRGLLVPVATALVLAVWAFHLRFLAKASRPT